MSKFADHVHISINAFSKRVIHSDLRLEQKMREHQMGKNRARKQSNVSDRF